MKLIAMRIHSDIKIYGYSYPETKDTPYWSMRYYSGTGYASAIHAAEFLLPNGIGLQ